MGMIDRVKNILLTPKTEWDVIAAEPTKTKDVVVGYLLPLAVVSAIAGFISVAIIGTAMGFLGGTARMPMMWALVLLVYKLVSVVIGAFVLAFIIDALAPTFGGQKNFDNAMKLVAYSYTAGVAGAVLAIIPILGLLLALLAALYCIYLLYLGLPKLMKNPPEKTLAYTVVIIVVAIVVGVIIGAVSTLVVGGAMLGTGHMGMGMGERTRPEVTYDPNSPMGKLDQFGKKMEEANKRMEVAQKSGDQKQQMEAAMGALGTALSGGKGVEPVQLDALKPMLPGTFASLPQKSTSSDRSGVPGLMGLASWMGIQGEHEDANRREVTRREGTRLVHEEASKTGGENKFTVVLADRFVVSASGRGVDTATLKSAVGSLDLGKIESIK